MSEGTAAAKGSTTAAHPSTGSGSSKLQYHKFNLSIEAMKNVPANSSMAGVKYCLAWHYDDLRQGATGEMLPSKGMDEVEFNFVTDFIVEHTGVVSRLLQLNVLAVKPSGERELAGVLMIDLNAHVPKPPSKCSKQRATLNMSRCSGPKPLLMRLAIVCAPTTSAAAQRSAVQRRQAATAASSDSVSAAGIGGPSSDGDLAPEDDTTATGTSCSPNSLSSEEQVKRLRMTIATLSAANEHLKDENTVLRTALNKSRLEADYTYTGGGTGTGISKGSSDSVAPTTVRSASERRAAQETEELVVKLQSEIETQKAEILILQRGLQLAREQLKASHEREQRLGKDINSLQRVNHAIEEELSSLTDQYRQTVAASTNHLSDAGISPAPRKPTPTAAIPTSGTKDDDVFRITQQMNQDLKSMLATVERQKEDLAAQLTTARKTMSDQETHYQAVIQKCQEREQEGLLKGERAEELLSEVTEQNKQLHEYCVVAQQRCKQLAAVVESERSNARRCSKQTEDMKAILSAHSLLERITWD